MRICEFAYKFVFLNFTHNIFISEEEMEISEEEKEAWQRRIDGLGFVWGDEYSDDDEIVFGEDGIVDDEVMRIGDEVYEDERNGLDVLEDDETVPEDEEIVSGEDGIVDDEVMRIGDEVYEDEENGLDVLEDDETVPDDEEIGDDDAEERERRRRKKEDRQYRLWRERWNPLEDMTDLDFRKQFRYSKEHVLRLTEKMAPFLLAKTSRSNPLSPTLQVCLSLFILGSGSFLRVSGLTGRVSTSTQSRVLDRFLDIICSQEFKDQFIYMPSLGEARESARKVEEKYNLPGFFGGVDGVHCLLGGKPRGLPRGQEPEWWRNRKDNFSINVMIVGNIEGRILDIDVSSPGASSSHQAVAPAPRGVATGKRTLDEAWNEDEAPDKVQKILSIGIGKGATVKRGEVGAEAYADDLKAMAE